MLVFNLIVYSKWLAFVFLYGFLGPNVSAESVYSKVDERLLVNPNTLQLKQESAGKVIIYDKVREQTINNALDENFDRMDNMMFINTVVKDSDGDYAAEDDCE